MSTIDRTQPCEVRLRWVPLSNPCDGITKAYWDEASAEWRDSPIGGTRLELGSFTHWAVPPEPEPADDISINWRLWQGSPAE
jgi:hypothetical protein